MTEIPYHKTNNTTADMGMQPMAYDTAPTRYMDPCNRPGTRYTRTTFDRCSNECSQTELFRVDNLLYHRPLERIRSSSGALRGRTFNPI